MMKRGQVSIVIANYNYAKYIRESIESALSQTYANIELLIIDDGSTDGSMKVINQYKKDERVRIIHRDNKGVISTRNQGLKESQGEFICFLDADDILPTDYIAKMIDVATVTGADVVYGDMLIINAAGEETGQNHIFPEFSLDKLKKYNFINMASLIRKKATVNHTFDIRAEKQGYTHEDWDFFLGLALSGKKIIKANDVFLHYRSHEGSRNGGVLEIDQNAKFIKSAIHINNKYKKIYPDEFKSNEDDPLRHWIKGVIGDREWLRGIIEAKDQEIREKDQRIANLSVNLSNVLNSKTYKAGRIISTPYRILARRKDDQ